MQERMGMSMSTQSDEEVAVKALFPARNRAQMLSMITELPESAIVPFAALGVIKRRFHSDVIAMFEDEIYSKKISVNRKGRLELSEVFVSAARRRASDEEY